MSRKSAKSWLVSFTCDLDSLLLSVTYCCSYPKKYWKTEIEVNALFKVEVHFNIKTWGALD